MPVAFSRPANGSSESPVRYSSAGDGRNSSPHGCARDLARARASNDFWIFHLPKLSRYIFWRMMHEARTDFYMLLGSLYLLIEGAGALSLDAMLACKAAPLSSPEDQSYGHPSP